MGAFAGCQAKVCESTDAGIVRPELRSESQTFARTKRKSLTCPERMTIEPTIPTSSPGAGALLRLIRDGQASTRAELVALTGLARSTVAQRMDALLAQRLVVPAGGSASTGGRPPQTFAFNRDAGVVLAADLGATHSRVAVTDLGGDVLAEARRGHPDRRRARRRSSAGSSETFDALLDEVGRTARRRARRRRRRPGPGRVRHRHPGGAADHARLGRLPRRRPAARPLRRAGARRQRREHHGAGRALDRPGATTTTCCSSRSAPASAAGSSPTAASTAAPKARPATSATSTSPTTTTSSAAAATSAASRRSPAAARWPRGCAPSWASPPRTAATSSATCATAGPRRCASSARPAASSAACSPRR